MNKLLWRCPVCSHDLHVTGLECAHCGTELSGQFGLGRFSRLDTDDLHFVEIFVKNRGNAYRVAEELEIPYSGVRAKVTQIIQAMGYDSEKEVIEETTVQPERRRVILEDLAAGRISSDQAVDLLQGAST